MKPPTQKTTVLGIVLASILAVPAIAQMEQPKAEANPHATTDDSQNKIQGKVSAKTDGAITVNYQAIKVNATTAISKGGTPAKIDDLSVGDKVAVTTTRDADGKQQAVSIEVLPEKG